MNGYSVVRLVASSLFPVVQLAAAFHHDTVIGIEFHRFLRAEECGLSVDCINKASFIAHRRIGPKG